MLRVILQKYVKPQSYKFKSQKNLNAPGQIFKSQKIPYIEHSIFMKIKISLTTLIQKVTNCNEEGERCDTLLYLWW